MLWRRARVLLSESPQPTLLPMAISLTLRMVNVVSFDVAAPQTLNLPQRDFGDVHPIAGEFVDGKVYVYRAELDEMYGQITPYDWAIYDAETNKRLDYHYTSGKRVVAKSGSGVRIPLTPQREALIIKPIVSAISLSNRVKSS